MADISPCNPLDKLLRFGRLLRKHPFSILFCTVIIVAILYVRISLAALAQDNSNNLLMLGSELLCESGPDFTRSAKLHREMLSTYANYMDRRNLVRLLGFFSDEFSTTKGLGDVATALANSGTDPQKTAMTIWQAGDDILVFRMSASSSSRTRIIFDESIEASPELLEDAEGAVAQSKAALQQVVREPDILQTYIDLCQDNRRSVLLLFLARSACDSQKNLFRDFLDTIKDANELSEKQANKFPECDLERELLIIIAKSEQRRLQVLNAIMAKDMERARTVLWQEIEEAYFARPKIMELYSKLKSAGKLESYR